MNNRDYYTALSALSSYTQSVFEVSPKCHDWDHTYRVLCNAYKIMAGESVANIRVIEIAALLHDIARPEEMARHGGICHAALGAHKCVEILPKFGFTNEAFNHHVCECVRTHRYRDDKRPATLEAEIIFDADKLDSIGAIGLGRAFHFAGRFGARVHNSKHEAIGSESYSKNDTAYREFLVKLTKIKGRMLTATGRQMAEKRHQFMSHFFKQLNEETGLY